MTPRPFTIPCFDGNATNKIKKNFNASPLFPPNFNFPDGLFSRRARRTQRGQPQPNPDVNRRQQRKRRDGPCPVTLCSLCFLLFKKSSSQSNIPRPGTARRPKPKPCRKEKVHAEAQRSRRRTAWRTLFPVFSLRSLRSLRGKKILATMRDSDGLQCKERIDKNLECLFSL